MHTSPKSFSPFFFSFYLLDDLYAHRLTCLCMFMLICATSSAGFPYGCMECSSCLIHPCLLFGFGSRTPAQYLQVGSWLNSFTELSKRIQGIRCCIFCDFMWCGSSGDASPIELLTMLQKVAE